MQCIHFPRKCIWRISSSTNAINVVQSIVVAMVAGTDVDATQQHNTTTAQLTTTKWIFKFCLPATTDVVMHVDGNMPQNDNKIQ